MIIKGVKFRAHPTSEQAAILSQWIGCARFIYNAKCDDDKYFRTFLRHSLSLAGERVPVDQTYSQYKTELTPWLNDCPSHILRNSAANWYRAYQWFFQGVSGRPKHKKKSNYGSVYLTSEVFAFHDGRLFIGCKRNNIGYLSFDAYREFDLPRSITISRHNDHWFVSFGYQDNFVAPRNPIEIIERLKAQGEEVLRETTTGLDRNVAIPLQASNGESYAFTQQQKASTVRSHRRIKKQQRRLARQQKGSKRRAKTRLKIGRAQEKIANIRKDFAHKTSRALVDSDAQIFIAEDLRLNNMTKRPKAQKDEDGKFQHNGARAKAGLTNALLSSALGSMILFLAYKTARANKVVIKLPPHFSSQECVECGHTHPDNRKTQAEFKCQSCGHSENADLQAAKVMRKRGVNVILKAAASDWEIKSDHTIVLAAASTRGTRGSARGGKYKTRSSQDDLASPQPDSLSDRSANLVVVASITRPTKEATLAKVGFTKNREGQVFGVIANKTG